MNQLNQIKPDLSRINWIYLLAFVAAGTLFGFLVGYLLSIIFFGPDTVRELSFVLPKDSEKIAALKLMQCFNHAGMFLLPSLFWLILIRGKYFYRDLNNLTTNGYKIIWITLISILISYTTLPLISFMYSWNQEFIEEILSGRFQDWLLGLESNSDRLLVAFSTDTSFGGFVVNLIMMAFLPAIGEELLFRGIIQRELTNSIHKPYLAIVLTSLLFSTVHFEFAGFIPRFLLSFILGFLFMKSGSLAFPILTHFLNNASVVVASYINQTPIGGDPIKSTSYGESLSLLILSVVVSILLLGLLGLITGKRKDWV